MNNRSLSSEGSYKAKIDCVWTYCADNTHMPTENGEYLVITNDGDYEILDYFTEGSEIVPTMIKNHPYFSPSNVDKRMIRDFGFVTKHIAMKSGFFDKGDDSAYKIRNDIYGYVKLSDINVFKIGEKNV